MHIYTSKVTLVINHLPFFWKLQGPSFINFPDWPYLTIISCQDVPEFCNDTCWSISISGRADLRVMTRTWNLRRMGRWQTLRAPDGVITWVRMWFHHISDVFIETCSHVSLSCALRCFFPINNIASQTCSSLTFPNNRTLIRTALDQRTPGPASPLPQFCVRDLEPHNRLSLCGQFLIFCNRETGKQWCLDGLRVSRLYRLLLTCQVSVS